MRKSKVLPKVLPKLFPRSQNPKNVQHVPSAACAFVRYTSSLLLVASWLSWGHICRGRPFFLCGGTVGGGTSAGEGLFFVLGKPLSARAEGSTSRASGTAPRRFEGNRSTSERTSAESFKSERPPLKNEKNHDFLKVRFSLKMLRKTPHN